jgi:L-lactate dehydrogenase (cytochrome)
VRRGETQAARAARAAGIPYTLSTVGMCGLAEVTKAAGVPPWFQLYVFRDRSYLESLIGQARDLGCPVLMLTVDMATAGRRWRDARNGFGGSPSLHAPVARAIDALSHPAWFWDAHLNGGPHVLGNLVQANPGARSLNDFWAWVRENLLGPFAKDSGSILTLTLRGAPLVCAVALRKTSDSQTRSKSKVPWLR